MILLTAAVSATVAAGLLVPLAVAMPQPTTAAPVAEVESGAPNDPQSLTGRIDPDHVGVRQNRALRGKGYVLGGGRWPGKKIRYHLKVPGKKYKRGVKQGAKAWNRSGIGIKFKKVKSARRADVLVRHKPNIGYAGLATLGNPGNRKAGVRLNVKKSPQYYIARVAAHEFGHILGLSHPSSGCSLMRSSFFEFEDGCNFFHRDYPERGWWYRCRLPERADVRGAIARYDGKMKLQRPANCLRKPAAGPVKNLTAQNVSGYARVSWSAGTRAADYVVRRSTAGGACRTSLPDYPNSVNQTTYLDTTGGLVTGARYCYTVWSRNSLGYPDPSARRTVSYVH